jgi:hypothetical protein
MVPDAPISFEAPRAALLVDPSAKPGGGWNRYVFGQCLDTRRDGRCAFVQYLLAHQENHATLTRALEETLEAIKAAVAKAKARGPVSARGADIPDRFLACLLMGCRSGRRRSVVVARRARELARAVVVAVVIIFANLRQGPRGGRGPCGCRKEACECEST